MNSWLPVVHISVQPVLWIHDILVWIPIRGSVSLTYESGFGSWSRSGSCSFLQCPSRCQQHFFLHFFAYYLLKVHLHHSLKKNSHTEVKNSRNQGFFLLVLLDDGRIRIRTNKMDPGPGGPKPYRSGSGSSTLLPTLGLESDPKRWEVLGDHTFSGEGM